jgi:branched-chain amino acid transport system ATP-binding protein
VLEVRNVYSRYGRIEVLHGVSLCVNRGEIVALIGSNGAGKTTLLRAISGVQPVTKGSILHKNECLKNVAAYARVKQGIAQVPEGRQIFAPLSVEDNLALGAWHRQSETRALLEAAYGAFPVLYEKRNERAGSLSGGQQQMLAISRALMSDPSIILLDEPSMGLSPLLVDQVFEAIISLRARGITVLLVEQNANLALSIADRAYVMETGKILLDGPAERLQRDPKVRAAYLGYS